MKKIIAITIALIISGCDDSSINILKKQEYPLSGGYSNSKVLDERSVCESVKWVEDKEKNTISYICRLKKGNRFFSFSFDENHAKKLRENAYEASIKTQKESFERSIERTKNSISHLKNENKELENIQNKARVVNVYELINDDSSGKNILINRIVHDSADELSETNDGVEFTKKTKSSNLFEGVNLHSNEFSAYMYAYNYLNNGDNGNNHSLKQSINSVVSACMEIEYVKNKKKLLSDEQWIKKINENEINEIKPVCEKKLSQNVMIQEKDYQSELKSCISIIYESNKPNYLSLADNEVRKQKNTDNCEILANEELKKIVDNYSYLLLKQIHTHIEKKIENNNKKISLESENIAYIRLQEDDTNKQNDLAKEHADSVVESYSMKGFTHGEEIITWKYSKVLDSYILSQAALLQYKHVGKPKSNILDLNVVLASSIDDVSNVDTYMELHKINAAKKLIDFFESQSKN